MITRNQFDRAVNIVHAYYKQESKKLSVTKGKIDSLQKYLFVKPDVKLSDVDMTVRLYNILKWHFFKGRGWEDEPSVSELATISKSEFFRCRNAGRKTLQELEQICMSAGIKLLP